MEKSDSNSTGSDAETIAALAQAGEAIKAEVGKIIVGQTDVINQVLTAFFARGHCVIEGVPGLAKTLMISSLTETMSLDFTRVQFTPDLMPTDITGTTLLNDDEHGKRHFTFAKGPVFTNILLADEINRTPPKTQAALLEAMEERQVTVAGQTRPLDAPFLVLATQNPIELEGTYPLPEAQLDRFLLNPVIQYLSTEDEIKMVSETTGIDREEPQPVLGAEDILTLQSLVRQVPAPENVVAYAVALVTATRPQADSCDEWTSKRVKWGAGSRGAQALILAAKARALLDGRANASSEDVKLMAKSALRHRVLPSFFAESEGLGADEIVDHLLETISA